MRKQFEWLPRGCTTKSVEKKDEWDKDKKKYIREIITVQECELVKTPVKTNPRKLTKEYLNKIIQEEIDKLLGKRLKDMNPRQRKSELFPGYDEMKKVSIGIMEDDEEELEEKCGDDIAGQRLHNKDGEWASYDDNVSWSLQKKGCGASKMKPGSKVRRATKLPCGSVARKQGKNVRCYDGKVLERDG
tara:strand:- start:36 stop:599 length:564 start_codon:yes stop_codon:yes gene_type:complete